MAFVSLRLGWIRRLGAVAAAWFCAAMFSFAVAQEFRNWTDISGTHTVRAKFVEVSNGKVILERQNGSQVSVPLEKLSKPDLDYITKLQLEGDNPFKDVKSSPKKRHPHDRRGDSGGDAGGSDVSDEAKNVQPDWSDAKQIVLTPGETKWNVSIESPKAAVSTKKLAIGLPAKRDFFEGVKGFVVSPVSRRGVVEYSLDRHGQTESAALRIIVCDLEKGKVTATLNATGKFAPLALNDAGTELLVRRDDFGFGNQDRLEVWRLGDSSITKLLRWTPYDDGRGPERDVKWARYVGKDRLVTVSSGGKLAVWDAATAEPVACLPIARNCRPALSPDRRHLAFVADDQVGVLDLRSLDVVAMTPFPKKQPVFGTALAFTPKGTRLACLVGENVLVFDTTTGALYREISLVGSGVHALEDVLCPNEEDVFVGNSLLIDMDTQARLWSYRGQESVRMLDGACWFSATKGDSNALFRTVLPQPEAVEKIQKALESPDLFALKPGATVKINAEAIEDPGEREKIVSAFTKQLQANGFQVGSDAAVEVVALTEKGRRREIGYRSIPGPRVRVYTFQEYVSRVKILCNGRKAWEVWCTNVPGVVDSRDETMEEYLHRHEHPNYDWFAKVELPKLVQKPSANGGAIGTSQVTTSGLR